MLRTIDAGVLTIAFEQTGPADGWPVVLLHGFPYDLRAYDAVAPRLVARGARVIMPYLRGFGPTRFRAAETMRSGEQAALGADLLALLDALAIERAILAGFDWGGRAACVVAALWPERVRGIVSQNGYNVLDVAAAAAPLPPEAEQRLWYQYYFHSERGRAGLARDRRAFCRLLWRLWSPGWGFGEAAFDRTAGSFDNPDFIDVVIHSYRHRFGLVAGDPAVAGIEAALARQPPIGVPAVVLDGAADGVFPPSQDGHARRFTGPHAYRIVPGAGHNVPQEAPGAFADAVRALHEGRAPA